MKQIYILFCMICVVMFSGCYEDKGNYNYHPINEVTITGIEELYSMEKWGELQICPELKTSLATSDNYSYSWEVDGFLVSENRDLNYTVDVDVADDSYLCRFTVTYVPDDSRFFSEFKLNVVSPYESGLIVLSEEDGKAMLSFKADGSDEFIKWIYYFENGEYLEGKPLSLEQPYWEYNSSVLVTTSRGNYMLDRQLMKLVKRYDGSTMLERDPNFEMKFCRFTDHVAERAYGCAIGTNGLAYPIRSMNDYFSLPSLLPIPNYYDATDLIDYHLSDKCLIYTSGIGGSTRRLLGYDEKIGQFILFMNRLNVTIDADQLNNVTVRPPVIGLPLMEVGIWSYDKYASFFYDPTTNVAKVVPSHNVSFQNITDEMVLTLDNHLFTPQTILRFCDATRRAIFSVDNKIYYLLMEDIMKAPQLLCDKLSSGVTITSMRVSEDRKRLLVGASSSTTTDRGNVYVIDMQTGEIMESYQNTGGKPVDIIEKW